MRAQGVFWLLSLSMSTPAFAEEEKTLTELETERLTQQTALLTAQANLANAKATLETARIDALGLPKFKNETTLESKGGEIEANMLASRAVRAASDRISKATRCTNEPAGEERDGLHYMLLTPAEKFDVNVPVSIELQSTGIMQQLTHALGITNIKVDNGFKLLDVGTIIGAIDAAASLFASETKVSGVDLSAINDAALIMATAGNLCGKGVVPSSSLGLIDLSQSPTIDRLGVLQQLKLTAVQERRKIPEKAKEWQKRRAAALDAAVAAHDAFVVKITTVDANGQSPLSQALLIERFPPSKTYLVRIAVNKAGGSIINTKNLWTMLGEDPVKVSGGMVVSFSITKADSGQVTRSETFTCQTSLASLRKVQDGRWTAWDSKKRNENPGDGKIPGEAFCR